MEKAVAYNMQGAGFGRHWARANLDGRMPSRRRERLPGVGSGGGALRGRLEP